MRFIGQFHTHNVRFWFMFAFEFVYVEMNRWFLIHGFDKSARFSLLYRRFFLCVFAYRTKWQAAFENRINVQLNWIWLCGEQRYQFNEMIWILQTFGIIIIIIVDVVVDLATKTSPLKSYQFHDINFQS